MPMNIPFERGQHFQSAVPGEDILVQVINPGGHGIRSGEVFIGTVRDDGKLIRQRWAKKNRFHSSWTLPFSVSRRVTGWVLVREL